MAKLTFPMDSIASAHRLPYNVDTDFAGVSICVFVPTVATAHPTSRSRIYPLATGEARLTGLNE